MFNRTGTVDDVKRPIVISEIERVHVLDNQSAAIVGAASDGIRIDQDSRLGFEFGKVAQAVDVGAEYPPRIIRQIVCNLFLTGRDGKHPRFGTEHAETTKSVEKLCKLPMLSVLPVFWE